MMMQEEPRPPRWFALVLCGALGLAAFGLAAIAAGAAG